MDLFPIDGLPDNAFLRGLVNFWCFILRKCSYAEIGMASEKSAFKRLLFRLLYLVPMSAVFAGLERITKKSCADTSEYVRILTLPFQFRGQTGYKREWFDQTSEIYEFEGYSFPGPIDVDGYLRSQHGDYMEMPPENERRPHRVAKIVFPEE
jgi:lipopolysaccharide cholinephosphotransferase